MSCCTEIYAIYAAIVTVIVVYWLVLTFMYGQDLVQHDFMNRIVFEMPFFENCCSLWPLSHFVLFFVIGFLYPHCDAIAVGGGILWELVEVMVFYMLDMPRQEVRYDGRIEYSGSWWAGSFKDVFFNIAGFYLGKLIVLAKKEKS